MNDNERNTTHSKKTSAAETLENYKHEARAKLILFYGINNPTETQVNMFILYGKKGVKMA